MALATGQNVRDWCNLAESATNELLTTHLNAAARELKDWIGEAKYQEAEAAQEGVQIKVDLAEAEAFLTYYYAVDFLGIKHTEAGFAVQGQLGDNQYSYLGPEKIRELKDNAWNRARKAAGPYIGSGQSFHLGISPAADE